MDNNGNEEHPMNDQHQKARAFFLDEGFFALDNKAYPFLQKYKQYNLLQEKTATAYIVWQDAVFGDRKSVV